MGKIQDKLNENIPNSVIETREAWRGGPKLSYLSGAYVINRLNEVLGQGNWGYDIYELNNVFEGEIEQSNGTAYTTSYIARVLLTVTVGELKTTFTDVGYGDGTDKKSKGKAHELATKEAVTDGLKRCAKNLGISMGLGLYFKSGEFVDEDAVPVAQAKPRNTPLQDAVNASVPITPQPVEALRSQIKNTFAVLTAKKVITKAQFVKDYLKGAKVDELEGNEARQILTTINQNFKGELGL